MKRRSRKTYAHDGRPEQKGTAMRLDDTEVMAVWELPTTPILMDDDLPTVVRRPFRKPSGGLVRPNRPCPRCGLSNALRPSQVGYLCQICSGEEEE